ncbi:DUF4249 domain-containing protein [Pseudoflavitalea sp. X16]|uniref:DUF4249 domain-containing protein n=1 Tax=Paraflavitalea devenefica TaxID=2716334 RepID=UPI0014211952|nr:DUF4249 domain-containing protein [Paraflavitalea devenefica]NII29474.1 DUF4249 domain-containing protein [Paraflavitalea devenefica]
MRILKNYLIMASCFLVISCEKVIKVELDTAAPKLVIDASIDWVKNTSGNEQKIKLSTTTAYYNDEFPAVSGASVVVTNSANTAFDFVENPGTGEYRCSNFQPVTGETYTLTISLNGETYTATETLMAVPEIGDNIEQNNTGGMAGDEVEITYYYQDDASQANYYLYSNKIPHIAFPQYAVEEDENSQGGLTPVYYSHKDLTSGDLVNIKLYGISGRYYDYFRKLLNASGNDGSPFATTPTAVRGNIVNQTNSKNFAYGYFRLSEVATRDYTIK